MSLVAATALSPITVHAAEIAPAGAHSVFENYAGFQREERRDARQEARANRIQAQRPEQQERRPDRVQETRASVPQPDVNRTERNRDGDGARTERRDARQDGRYYDRNRDGRLDRRFDRNDDERIDRAPAGRWTNNWRNDKRYNWHSYREQNRNDYRPGRYYAPYRDRNYSRISIGFSLGSGFYGSRYWINDPWQYRLPAAYGSYRWVRYYDDVLLVDVRNGRVVDVIPDFFW
ncbi:MAG: hypothetical protein B7Y00_08540 [Sphingomonadales bacterium 17-56-6]|nr:MAG: hypothetical protein B7Y44_04055 [Sphingomonadales bacterium 28-55-16]OYZ84841.1 MAG: hypothetical protein B7Y00_08540 [Sphingomonadales bacterium 17-56-6]